MSTERKVVMFHPQKALIIKFQNTQKSDIRKHNHHAKNQKSDSSLMRSK